MFYYVAWLQSLPLNQGYMSSREVLMFLCRPFDFLKWLQQWIKMLMFVLTSHDSQVNKTFSYLFFQNTCHNFQGIEPTQTSLIFTLDVCDLEDLSLLE